MAKNQIDYDKRDGKTRVNIKNIHMFLVNDLKSPNQIWDGLCNVNNQAYQKCYYLQFLEK